MTDQVDAFKHLIKLFEALSDPKHSKPEDARTTAGVVAVLKTLDSQYGTLEHHEKCAASITDLSEIIAAVCVHFAGSPEKALRDAKDTIQKFAAFQAIMLLSVSPLTKEKKHGI